MTRRELLSTTAVWAAPRLWGQTAYPGVAYRDYTRCLPDFLRTLAQEAYRKRNAEIAKLTTADAIRRRQRWVVETFWKLIGGQPERTALNARTTGSFDRDGYRVEKIVYESRPEFFITSNLYVPTAGKPPFPGVLFQMGHSLNGKAYDSYQKCCQGLARLGFLVLAFDPMGQGERVYYPRPHGNATRLPSADDEHTVPGKQMLLVGDTSSRLQVWDAIRSLDYLASHPLVDPQRLGSTGQSGGGTLTMLLAAVDDRLAAAVVSSGNTENVACSGFIPPGSTDDAEQNFLGSGLLAFDRWDVLYPLAPKSLLVLASAKDFFGTYSPNYIAGGWEEFQKLKRVYGVLGHAGSIEYADTPLPHTLSYDLRLRTYNWFTRWLKRDPHPVAEEPLLSIEKDETLYAGASGNVIRDFKSQTPFTLNRARAAQVRTPDRPDKLEALLGVARPAEGLRAAVLGRVKSRLADVEAIEVHSADKVWAPAWLFLPRQADPSKHVLILAESGGRNSNWREDQLYEMLAAEGRVVCAIDVRGVGDLSPEFGRGDPRYQRYHEDEESYAWSSLILGKPLLGQRVTDMLAFVRALRGHEACRGRKLVVAASGKMTVPALFAAALEPAIDRLFLLSGLVSFRAIVETENYRFPFADFVPRLLFHTDLPQLAAAIAPRPVRMAGTVDAEGRRMEPAAIREAYGAAKNVEVLPSARWDVATLSQV